MAVWLVRAGRRGDREEFNFENNVAVIGWDALGDLSRISTREELRDHIREAYPDAPDGKVSNYLGQFWAFSHRIGEGDLIAMPLKGRGAIAFGRVTGPYRHEPSNAPGTQHTLPIEWFAPDVSRDRFDPDTLQSLGALMTVCEIRRNDAESRIRAILEGKTPPPDKPPVGDEGSVDPIAALDLEEWSNSQIHRHLRQRFTGHKMADLIDSILQAQGFHTHVSPPGPDGGVDIIAGRGAFGFDLPRLVVQVKATGASQNVNVLRELKGVMSDFGAQQGLLVSWSGFKRSVHTEARRAFFEVRLWDASDILQAIQKHYEQFSDELKADLPLKRIWMLVPEEG